MGLPVVFFLKIFRPINKFCNFYPIVTKFGDYVYILYVYMFIPYSSHLTFLQSHTPAKGVLSSNGLKTHMKSNMAHYVMKMLYHGTPKQRGSTKERGSPYFIKNH